MNKIKLSTKLILLVILILAAAFRLYNVNWDQGFHLHPDERAIIMAVTQLKFPQSINEFFFPASTWNPHFFAYGSFPMYLLWTAGWALSVYNASFGQYTSINLVGRVISAFADLITIVLIFKLTTKLFHSKIALAASFFYAISVLPIQLSHFFAVDTLLTCFITGTLYALILFYEKPNAKTAALAGLFFGLSLATKISALVLLASIGAALSVDFALIFFKKPHHPKHWLPHLPLFLKHLIKYAFIIISTSAVTFLVLEPYSLIDFRTFWAQTIQQSALTVDPFYFPYTLQYVGKIPYVYELKNIFLWGLGPVQAFFAFAGAVYFILKIFKNKRPKEIIIFVFFLSYFLITGKFAVGFMRYMLPLYPIFCIFTAILIYKFTILLNISIKNKFALYTLYFILYTLLLAWPLSFIHIYASNNTRTDATNWINQNIPAGKNLAIEHWDDALPLVGQERYQMLTLALYDPDSDLKWSILNNQLAQTDYIIIASNRLYAPLQKLTDCRRLPSYRCYPRTSAYYKKLLSGNLGFKKVAEFTNYPTVPLFNIKINDQSADENFTVFDHPKIMIFQKTRPHSTM